MNTFEKELLNLTKANVKLIQIISYERLRIHAMLNRVAIETDRKLYRWDRNKGIEKWNKETKEWSKETKEWSKENEELDSPDRATEFYSEHDNLILLLEDFYPDLTEDKPKMIEHFRNIALQNTEGKTIVFSQPFYQLPKELEKDVHIIELPYPDYNDLKVICEKACQVQEPEPDIIEAALGLTIMEASKAFRLAKAERGQLTEHEVPLIIREKENVIKKSGYLEYYHPQESMEDIGGLGQLKSWLGKRRRGFDKYAKEFGLMPPKGILLLGIPGTGKSLIAKAIGNSWQFPLLRLDMGKIFGGIVGESENNMRGALKIAEAISPSILWIDEIEKGMSGIASSGSTDGGTTARVLGTFLTWMQEKSKAVFVVATANDISQLPPELLRKGRVDEIFFVDLPTEKERTEIIKIHLKRKKRKPEDYDIAELAKQTKGFSGAELEEVIKDALFQAYDDGKHLETSHISDAIKKTYPLSRTMNKTIKNMRMWAKSRTVRASDEDPEELDNGENGPKLKQESYNNPFI